MGREANPPVPFVLRSPIMQAPLLMARLSYLDSCKLEDSRVRLGVQVSNANTQEAEAGVCGQRGLDTVRGRN